MESSAKLFFRKLSFKQELLTYSIPVPLALHFAIISGNFSENQMKAVVISLLIVAFPITLLFGVYSRYKRLYPKLNDFYNRELDEMGLQELKRSLMKEPAREGLFNVIRWIFGTALTISPGHIFVPMGLTQYVSALFVIIMTIPMAFVYAYFISEKELSDILMDPKLAGVIIKYKTSFTLLKKIMLLLFALIWYPLVIFGFMFYVITNNIIQLTNIGIHIISISLMLLIILFIIAYIFTRSMKTYLDRTLTGIEDFSKGRLDVNFASVTTDEIGFIGDRLNSLKTRISSIIEKVTEETNTLILDSLTLSRNALELSDKSKDISSSVEEVGASLEQLGSSSENIASNSKVQSDEVNSINEYFQLLSDKIKDISQKASEASELSVTTETKASNGEKILQETVSKIKNIQVSTQSINDSASVIKDIADRVNLLSLNASIEAARAGEYGRGFSVVAEEISKLADSTQQNADIITKRISNTMKDVDDGIISMNQTAQSFGEIIEHVRESAAIMSSIYTEAQEQMKMRENINRNFDKILTMTSDNYKSTQEQSLTFQEFLKAVESITESIQIITDSVIKISEFSKSLHKKSEELSKEISFFN